MKKQVWKVTNYGVSIYPLCMLGGMLYYDVHKLAGKDYAKGIGTFSNGINHWAVVPGSHEKISKLVTPKIISNKKWTQQIIKKIYQTSQDLIIQTNKIFKTDLTKKTDQQLLQFYQQYNKKFRIAYLYGWLPNMAEGLNSIFSRKLEEVLLARLETINKTDKVGEYFSILTTLPKDSERDKEQKEFLKLLPKAKTTKNLDNLFSRHQVKYNWLQYDYDGPELPLNYFVDQAKTLLKSKIRPAQELKKIAEQHREIITKQKKYEKELKLNQQEKYLFWLARQFAFLKNYRKDILYKSYYQNDKLLKEIGRRLGLSVRQVKHILPSEMPEVLIKKKYNPNLLNQRIKYSVLVYGPKQPQAFVGSQAKKIIRDKVTAPKVKTKIKELKGQVAFSGKASGKVKIVNTVEDMKGFKQGEILVSEKTNPNLIAAMKKAAAIVTNTGGLTCHAAIVSRELKIPCIVGTEIATQVLQDGDKVEVDANKGIVKKI